MNYLSHIFLAQYYKKTLRGTCDLPRLAQAHVLGDFASLPSTDHHELPFPPLVASNGVLEGKGNYLEKLGRGYVTKV